jgi:hypothetical protein
MDTLYPSKIIWRLHFTPGLTSEAILGKTIYKRVMKTLPLLEEAGYRFMIEPITDAWLKRNYKTATQICGNMIG